MRLTLRTLLAYMDDILDAADHEELGRKIETSAFATELIHRSRDTVRRLRLSAPDPLAGSDGELHGGDAHLDPNTMAEYLDNTLPPDGVTEFERSCLEAGDNADMLLAEAASCHHILTMVLGEPAEVDSDMRERMYRLADRLPAAPHRADSPTTSEHVVGDVRLRIEPAHLAPHHAPPQAAAAQASHVQHAGQAPASASRELPDYLVVAARARRRARTLTTIGVLAALVGGVAAWLALAPESKGPAELAKVDRGAVEAMANESLVGETTAGTSSATTDITTAPAGEEVPGQGLADAAPAAPPVSDPNATAPPFVAAEQPAVTPPAMETPAAPGELTDTAATSDTPAVPPQGAQIAAQPPATGDAPAPPGTQDGAPPAADATAGTGVPPVASDSTAGSIASVTGAAAAGAPGVDAGAGPVAMEPQVDAPPMTAPDRIAMVGPGAAGDATAAETIPPDVAVVGPPAAPPTEPAAPRPLGTYLGLGNEDLLLRYDSGSQSWIRLAPRSNLAPGDKLATIPTLRTPIVLRGANVYLAGGTIVELIEPTAEGGGADFAISIPAGRVIINSSLEGNRIEISSGEFSRVVELGPSSSMAVEVVRQFVPGANPERDAAPIAVDWHLTSGKATWGPEDAQASAQAPATWMTKDGEDDQPRDDATPPEWIDREPATNLQQTARQKVATALVPGEPVNVRLLELADPKGLGRQREVRSLVAQSGALVGIFDPIVKALGDVDQRTSWDADIEMLRAALVRDPAAADGIRAALASQRGDAAADDLMEMVRGFDADAVGRTKEEVREGALVRLINWLQSDDLVYRVLADYNIGEITGKSRFGDYRPEQTADQRRRATERYYWPRLESGELGPK